MTKAKIVCISGFLLAMTIAAVSGEYVTRPMGTAGVTVTNDQKNASWDLSAVAIKFGETLPVATETVRVTRVSQGIEIVLGSSQQFGESMVLSLPEGMTFRFGDVVKVYGGGATGIVQVFTK